MADRCTKIEQKTSPSLLGGGQMSTKYTDQVSVLVYPSSKGITAILVWVKPMVQERWLIWHLVRPYNKKTKTNLFLALSLSKDKFWLKGV